MIRKPRRRVATLNMMTGFFALAFVAVGIFSQLTAMPAQAYSADAFVMKIDTTKVSESHTSFVIPMAGDDFNYTIDCDDTGPMEPAPGQTGGYTCSYDTPGVYTIVITGTFPHVSMMSIEEETEAMVNAKALMSIEQWGTQQWRSMEYMFAFAQNMTIAASAGIPDLSQVTSMQGMFTYAYSFNSPLSDWDVSNVTDMSGMFQLATSFNQPLDSWDVSNVTGMAYMFAMASSFDYSLGAWDLNGEVNTMGILEDSAYSAKSYDATLRAWSSRADVLEQVSFDARDLHYCAGVEARAALVETHDWSIENDTENCTVVHPTITSVEIKPEGEKQVMIINGENLLLGGDPDEEISNAAAAAIVYGGQVHVNGQKYNWCLPDGFTLEDVGPMPVSDNPPCFYYYDPETDQLLFSDTQFKIWLPDVFDSSAPGTVSIWKAPAFKFNQPIASPAVLQPLTTVAADASIATPLRTATLGVSENKEYQGCANIDALRTQLFAPDTVTAPTGTTILGGVGFELDCESSGGSAQVSLRLGTEYPDTSTLSAYKDLVGDGSLTPVNVTFVNRDGATYAEFPLTDGLTDTPTGLVDEDGAEDGRIVDPLYIGVQTGAVSPQDGSSASSSIGTMTPAAPNSGFATTIATLTSKTTTPLWIVVGVVLGAAILVIGALLRRQTQTS